MDLTKMLLTYKECPSSEQQHEIAKTIGCFVEQHADENEISQLKKTIYGIISDRHYNQEYANDAIKQMYYEDEDGVKHYAPYYTDEEVKEVFELNKEDISDYTIHDLAVTMNMLRSDNNYFLKRYAESSTKAKDMVTCMAIEYLQDVDAPFPTQKIWRYVNG
jgi:hypothetical protein